MLSEGQQMRLIEGDLGSNKGCTWQVFCRWCFPKWSWLFSLSTHADFNCFWPLIRSLDLHCWNSTYEQWLEPLQCQNNCCLCNRRKSLWIDLNINGEVLSFDRWNYWSKNYTKYKMALLHSVITQWDSHIFPSRVIEKSYALLAAMNMAQILAIFVLHTLHKIRWH